MIAMAAGAAYAKWRSSISTYITELGELLASGELSGDAGAAYRERALAIIAASTRMGVLGPGWNRPAYDAMCALCRDVASDALFPRFYACLAGIRRALRCERRVFL